MFGKNKKGNFSDSEYGAMLGGHLNFAASEAYKLLRTNLVLDQHHFEQHHRVYAGSAVVLTV